MSKQWIVVSAAAASVLAAWAILASEGLPLPGLLALTVLGSLALLASIWVGRKAARSTAQVIHDVEGEPMLAQRGAGAAPRAGL